MKESRSIAHVPAAQGELGIAAQIIAVVKNAKKQVSVGVRFEQPSGPSHIGATAFVDADEIEELLAAFEFMSTTASRMATAQRDYTEVSYSTRDDVTIGFYQDGEKQQAFVRFGRSHMFFGIVALSTIREAIAQAKDYVSSRRVAWETR